MTSPNPPPVASAVGPVLAVRNLVKRFGKVAAVDDVSFSVAGGTFLTLLGPSGSGKTTVLRLLGGFETPDAGSIALGGADIGRLPPYKRDIGVVFQRYALFPHMNVAENVGFSLRQRGVATGERARRITEALEMVGLEGLGGRAPSQLSGGQQQRVALARALVFKPRILVMDEPLAALDKHLRERLQDEIRALQRRLGITTVYVTHDQAEAFVMSDIVAVMNAGKIEQIAAPRALYEAPRTEFVARFVGDSNIFRGPVNESRMRLADGVLIAFAGNGAPPTALMVRPEKIRIGKAGHQNAGDNLLQGWLIDMRFLGDACLYRVRAGAQEIVVRDLNRTDSAHFAAGDEVILTWPAADTVPLS